MVKQDDEGISGARRLQQGLLSPSIDGFAALLAQEGYGPATVRGKRQVLDELSRWLKRRKLHIADRRSR